MANRGKAGMRPGPEPAAERAAAKIRRVAAVPEQASLDQHAKNRADTEITEAHAELGRGKHYRGNPGSG